MTNDFWRMAVGRACALSAMIGVAACTMAPVPDEDLGGGPGPVPAGLQVACANGAGPLYGVDPDTISPLGVDITDDNHYAMKLDVGNDRQAVCTVDSNGNVIGVTDM